MDYAVIAKSLAQYAYNLIGTQLKTEIEFQFDAWMGPASFTARVGEAVDTATKTQTETIKASEEEKKRTIEKAMFFFSIIAPIGLSWMAGKLQYSVGPKIYTKYKGSWEGDVPVISLVENKVASKMLADISKELVSKGFPGLVALNVPDVPDVSPNVGSAGTSGMSLKFEMEAQIKDQKQKVIKSLMATAQNINNDREAYGRDILATYDKEALNRDASETATQVELGCQRLINKIVNETRATLATKYPMYGTDPPKPQQWILSKTFERYLWAMWLVKNDFRVYVQREAYPGPAAVAPNLPVIGPGNGEYLDKTIALHILELTGLTTLTLQYEKADHVDMAFTRDAVTSLRKWADDYLKTAPQKRMDGTTRTLKPIETYF